MAILMLLGTLNWSHKVLKSLLALQFMLCIWIKPLGNATHRDFAEHDVSLEDLLRTRGHMSEPWRKLVEEAIWEGFLVGAGKPVRGWLRYLNCGIKETRADEAPVLFQCPLPHVSQMKLQMVLECLSSPAHPNQQHCHPLWGKENFQIILCW